MEQIFNEDGSLLDNNKIEFLSDKGSEFIVYKYFDLVIKIYKKDYQLSHLSLEELNVLKRISTQRILLPSGILKNGNNELVGYEMPLITGEKHMDYDRVPTFFEELEILRKDLELLCIHFIILRDINLSNTIYNGHIYLVDPGNYLVNELDQILFQTSITIPSIMESLKKIALDGDYSKVKNLINSLSLEEKLNIVRTWNYDKINKLIDMLLFSKRKNIDPFKYRQIVQFILKERDKNGFIYNLDVLKMYLNQDLCIRDAINEFIKKYVHDNPEERKLFLSLYKKKNCK